MFKSPNVDMGKHDLRCVVLKCFVVDPKREWHDGQKQIMGTKNDIGKVQRVLA